MHLIWVLCVKILSSVHLNFVVAIKSSGFHSISVRFSSVIRVFRKTDLSFQLYTSFSHLEL